MENLISINGMKFTVSCDKEYDANNQPVIEIFEENGCPAGVISVCIPSHSFEENETALCGDVPQNEVVNELERQGIAKGTGKIAYSGYGIYPVIKVTAEALSA